MSKIKFLVPQNAEFKHGKLSNIIIKTSFDNDEVKFTSNEAVDYVGEKLGTYSDTVDDVTREFEVFVLKNLDDDQICISIGYSDDMHYNLETRKSLLHQHIDKHIEDVYLENADILKKYGVQISKDDFGILYDLSNTDRNRLLLEANTWQWLNMCDTYTAIKDEMTIHGIPLHGDDDKDYKPLDIESATKAVSEFGDDCTNLGMLLRHLDDNIEEKREAYQIGDSVLHNAINSSMNYTDNLRDAINFTPNYNAYVFMNKEHMVVAMRFDAVFKMNGTSYIFLKADNYLAGNIFGKETVPFSINADDNTITRIIDKELEKSLIETRNSLADNIDNEEEYDADEETLDEIFARADIAEEDKAFFLKIYEAYHKAVKKAPRRRNMTENMLLNTSDVPFVSYDEIGSIYVYQKLADIVIGRTLYSVFVQQNDTWDTHAGDINVYYYRFDNKYGIDHMSADKADAELAKIICNESYRNESIIKNKAEFKKKVDKILAEKKNSCDEEFTYDYGTKLLNYLLNEDVRYTIMTAGKKRGEFFRAFDQEAIIPKNGVLYTIMSPESDMEELKEGVPALFEVVNGNDFRVVEDKEIIKDIFNCYNELLKGKYNSDETFQGVKAMIKNKHYIEPDPVDFDRDEDIKQFLLRFMNNNDKDLHNRIRNAFSDLF